MNSASDLGMAAQRDEAELAVSRAAGAPRIAVVVTTYNRSRYLSQLLSSLQKLSLKPDFVVVVDNASTDDTQEVISAAAKDSPFPIHSLPLSENVGGAGGFATGIREALSRGAEWMWVMDDDVEAIDGALEAFAPWMNRYGVIHGRRFDYDGRPFFWQHDFNSWLGVALPVRGDVFAGRDVFHTNVACFEGMLVSAEVIREYGIPDSRFFVNGDDTMFGWSVSRREPVALINNFVLRKSRSQRQIDLGIRHLNDSSDLSRYLAMRNRGLIAQYLLTQGKFSRVGFGIGTALTFAKEVARLVLVEHQLRGLGQVIRGWRESRTLMRQAPSGLPAIQEAGETRG